MERVHKYIVDLINVMLLILTHFFESLETTRNISKGGNSISTDWKHTL